MIYDSPDRSIDQQFCLCQIILVLLCLVCSLFHSCFRLSQSPKAKSKAYWLPK